MFYNIFKFEIKYWLFNPAYYFYIIFFLLLGLGTMAGAAGLFEEGSSSLKTANSPLSIFSFVMFFSKLMLFLLPAIIGVSVYRDHKSGIYNFFYSYPFTKTQYLLAKFFSSFLAVNIIALFFLLGLLIAALLPWIQPERVLPPDFSVYARIYFIFLLPNLMLFGLVVFTVVALSKNIYSGFITIVVLFIIRESASRLAGAADTGHISLLIEPFGEAAVSYFTRNYTLSQINELSIPINSTVLFNRVLWLGVTGIFIFLQFKYFSFESALFKRFRKKSKSDSKLNNKTGNIIKLELPIFHTAPGFWNNFKVACYLSGADLKYIIKSGPFISIVISGIILISVILLQTNPHTGTKILPVTWSILGLPVFFFSMLIIVLTFLYAGVLLNRSKIYGIDQLINSSPVPDWVLLLSKFTALIIMQMILLLVIMLSGIGVQIFSGYYRFEFEQYLFALFIIHLSGFVIWASAALLIQTFFSNSYIGLFLLIIAAIGISNLPYAGIENMIFRFNQNPEPDFFMKLSDISGYGHSLTPFFIYKTYWFLFGMIILFITFLFWRRELTETLRERTRAAVRKLNGKITFGILILLCSFVFYGYFIYKESINPESINYTPGKQEILLEEFKGRYSRLRNLNQPRITSVFVKLELYPESSSFLAEGNYTLINKSGIPVDTLLVNTGFDEYTDITFGTKAEKLSGEPVFNFSVYLLSKPLIPGDSLYMNFTIRNKPNTLLTENSNILKNGSYIKSDIFPVIGYMFDSSTSLNHYQRSDADLVDISIIAGTSGDQTVIAPGKVDKQWKENNRSYTRFKTDNPVKFVFGIHSGKYNLHRDNHNGTGIEIYYHGSHDKNLKQVTEGLKQALDYNIAFFGPYQHSNIRVVEYPRSLGTYATTAANTISISELRFLNDSQLNDEDGTDLLFYIAAHELSHQWWGNQVMPANVAGALMLTESITEYITAKIYEKRYGKTKATRFLKNQLERYLSGRTGETGIEPPLNEVDPERTYISYGKGAMAFYALSEYIGENNLNRALRSFYDKFRFSGPPYPVPTDLLFYIDAETPDSLKYLIDDLFKKVCFCDNKLLSYRVTPVESAGFRIDADFIISKYALDNNGNSIFTNSSGQKIEYSSQGGEVISSLPLNDYIELGYREKSGKIISIGKYKVTEIHNSVSLLVFSEPIGFLIDPYGLLIETERTDNR